MPCDILLSRYEKSVCICTGAQPRVLPGAASCEERILTLRDVESVHSLQEKLKDAKRVVIVGNGGIATELVYKVRGVQVKLILHAHFIILFVYVTFCFVLFFKVSFIYFFFSLNFVLGG
jgi:NAD(P)H-nitrite reductase large subunit